MAKVVQLVAVGIEKLMGTRMPAQHESRRSDSARWTSTSRPEPRARQSGKLTDRNARRIGALKMIGMRNENETGGILIPDQMNVDVVDECSGDRMNNGSEVGNRGNSGTGDGQSWHTPARRSKRKRHKERNADNGNAEHDVPLPCIGSHEAVSAAPD